MKKLFVLFLLVALVPFTVGCGLFGDNDDTTPVNINGVKLTASALLPVAAASNLRGATVAANIFKGFTMSLNNVELIAETETETTGGYNVTFSKVISKSDYEKAKQGVVPVIIKTAAAKTIVQIYVNTAAVTTTAPLAVTVTADSTSSTGFAAPTATVGDEYHSQTPTTVAPALISFSSASAGLKPSISATFKKQSDNSIVDIFATTPFTTSKPSTITFDVGVRKDGAAEFEMAKETDFTYEYNATTATLKVTVASKSLTAGRTYEVVVRSIKVNGVESVLSNSTKFTVTAQ